MTSQDILTTELAQKEREGARPVDVRGHDNDVAGHIPGAVNLPLSELMSREDGTASGTILICASGDRSSQAAASLASLGKTGLTSLLGGTVAWMRQGRELNRSEQP